MKRKTSVEVATEVINRLEEVLRESIAKTKTKSEKSEFQSEVDLEIADWRTKLAQSDDCAPLETLMERCASKAIEKSQALRGAVRMVRR